MLISLESGRMGLHFCTALLCYKMFKILLKHEQCHLSYEFFNSWVYFHWNFNFSKKIICGVSIIFLLSTSWITKWLELINIFILILAVFNRCLSFIFSFCSETSMGKGGQNNQRKVNHFPAYIFPVLVMNFVSNVLSSYHLWHWCVALFSLCNSESHMNTCLFRYDPELDGRILLGKVDCTQEPDLCRRYS